jgi:hypothetical protein
MPVRKTALNLFFISELQNCFRALFRGKHTSDVAHRLCAIAAGALRVPAQIRRTKKGSSVCEPGGEVLSAGVAVLAGKEIEAATSGTPRVIRCGTAGFAIASDSTDATSTGCLHGATGAFEGLSS